MCWVKQSLTSEGHTHTFCPTYNSRSQGQEKKKDEREEDSKIKSKIIYLKEENICLFYSGVCYKAG